MACIGPDDPGASGLWLVGYDAVRADGTKEVATITSGSLVEAERILAARGLRAIRFHPPGSPPPDAVVRERELDETAWWLAFVPTWATIVLVLAGGTGLVGWVLGSALIGAAVGVVLSALWAWSAVPVELNDRVAAMLVAGRYDAALAAATFLGRFPRVGLRRQIDDLLRAQRARALAGLGRVDEALGVIASLANGTAHQRERHRLLLPGVYGAAGDHARQIAAQRAALAAAPESAVSRIDLAFSLVVLEQAYAEAAELVAALPAGLSPVEAAWSDVVRGIVTFQRSGPEEGRAVLDAAIGSASALGPVLAAYPTAVARAFRARALARLGEADLSERDFLDALPPLLDARAHALIDTTRAELDRAHEGNGGSHPH